MYDNTKHFIFNFIVYITLYFTSVLIFSILYNTSVLRKVNVNFKFIYLKFKFCVYLERSQIGCTLDIEIR